MTREPFTGVQIRIGVMGSASEPMEPTVAVLGRGLGRAIADRGCCLLTGACPGLPHEAVFFMAGWREGRAGAFVMGLRHGLCCLGCCWALMALLFVAGVMNLLWVAAIAVAVLVEKVVPRGDLVGRLAGVVLVAAGVLLVARGVLG